MLWHLGRVALSIIHHGSIAIKGDESTELIYSMVQNLYSGISFPCNSSCCP